MILATAGSAVGLGNVWRFPYMAGQNGGAAFILIYLACIAILGVPGMVSEFVVGRHSGANAARAYQNLSKGSLWGIIGYMGIFTSMIILGFYAVVAGWCLQYLFASVLETVIVDGRFHYSDACLRCARRSCRNRESIQTVDAHLIGIVICYCGRIVYVAGGRKGDYIFVTPRFFETFK